MRMSNVWKIESEGYPLGVYVIADSIAEASQTFYAFDAEQKQKRGLGASATIHGCLRILTYVIVPEATTP